MAGDLASRVYTRTVNCSYTGLGLGLRFFESGVQEIRYIRIPDCKKHTVSCFCGTLKVSVRYRCEFRYNRVRYKTN